MRFCAVITIFVSAILVCLCSAYASADELQPIANAAQLKVTMDEINFDHNSEILSLKAREVLEKHVEVMRKDADIQVSIEGHCDENGSDKYNLELGKNRANAVRTYMIKNGILPERLSIVSYGKKKPLAVGHDEIQWAKNRRVEFVIISN